MNKRTLYEATLQYAKAQQAACGENTVAWIMWERAVMGWEERLCLDEVNEGPPGSIIRERTPWIA